MNKIWQYSIAIAVLIITITLIYSCKKDEVITGIVARESYINNTGHNLQIKRYMRNIADKSFDLAKDDTLIIETSLDAGADSTGSIFRSDSALVIFDDTKSYTVDDTTSIKPNFLKSRRTISPSGKIHYYRYTFTESDYQQAQ